MANTLIVESVLLLSSICLLLTSGYDVCQRYRRLPSGFMYTDCVKHADNKYQWAVCITRNENYRGHSMRTNTWQFCGLKKPNHQCACNGNDENTQGKTELAQSCFTSKGDDCSWYTDCLLRSFPCLSSEKVYKFINSFCTNVENAGKIIGSGDSRKNRGIHKCIHDNFFVVLIRKDAYSCPEAITMLTEKIKTCFSRSSRDLQSMDARQYVFWTLKELLADEDLFSSISGPILNIFDVPLREIIPNIVFITRSIVGAFLDSGSTESWTKKVSDTLKWQDKHIQWVCKYTFEQDEKERRKRQSYYPTVQIIDGRLECHTGFSLDHRTVSEYEHKKYILADVEDAMKKETMKKLAGTTTLTHAYVEAKGMYPLLSMTNVIILNDQGRINLDWRFCHGFYLQ